MSEDKKKRGNWIARNLDRKTVSKIAPWTWVLWRRTNAIYWGTGYRAGEKPPYSGDLLVQSPYTDWYNLTWGLAPNQDMPKWRWMYRSRPEIKGGVDKKIILAVGKGISVVCEDDDEIEGYVTKLLDVLNMRDILQSAVHDMLVYGQAYFEKVRTTSGDKQEGEEIAQAPEEARVFASLRQNMRRQWVGSELDTNDPAEATSALRDWIHDVQLIDDFLGKNADTMESEIYAPKASIYNAMLNHTLRKKTVLYQAALYLAGLSKRKLKRYKAVLTRQDRNTMTPSLREEEFQAPEGELVELKPIDPLWMRINRDAFGNVIGFVQWGLTPIPQAVVMEKLVYMKWMPKSWSYENAYGCVAEDTLVSTPWGFRRIQDIQEGDSVYSYNEGKLTEEAVFKKFAYGKQGTMKFETRHRTIEVTDNHPLLVQTQAKWRGYTGAKGDIKLEWKEAKDIKEGDFIVVSKNLQDAGRPHKLEPAMSDTRNHWRLKQINQPEYTTPEFCRLLGFMLGDGWISNNAISFAESVYPEQNRLYEDLLQNTFGIIGKLTNQMTQFRVDSQLVVKFLEINGWVNGAHNKVVPEWVLTLPRDQRIAFVEGFMDADGWESNDGRGHNAFSIEIVNLKLLEGLKAVIESIGWKCGMIRHRNRTLSWIAGHRTSSNPNGHHCLTFYKSPLGYKNTEGFSVNFQNENFATEKVVAKTIGKKNVYDLNIPTTSNFIAGGVVAHNTSSLMPVQRHVSLLIQAEEDMKIAWHQYATPKLHFGVGTAEKPYPAPMISSFVNSVKNRTTTTDIVTPGDVTVKEIIPATTDTAKTFEIWAKYLREKIYETLAIPDVLMNLPGEMTRATSDVTLQAFIAEEKMIQELVGEQFLKQVIEPEVRRHFAAKYPDGQVPSIKINWPPILEEDRNKKIDRLVKSVGVPFETVNEARTEASLAPLDDQKYDELQEQPLPGLGLDPFKQATFPSKNPEISESQRTGSREESLMKRDADNPSA